MHIAYKMQHKKKQMNNILCSIQFFSSAKIRCTCSSIRTVRVAFMQICWSSLWLNYSSFFANDQSVRDYLQYQMYIREMKDERYGAQPYTYAMYILLVFKVPIALLVICVICSYMYHVQNILRMPCLMSKFFLPPPTFKA